MGLSSRVRTLTTEGTSVVQPSQAPDAGRPAAIRVSGRPLWRSVHDDLLRRLEQGDFAESFPGEMALAAEYRISRSTVRAALDPLRRRGLVTADRGRRPVVVSIGEEHRFGPVYSLFAAVEAAGMDQRSEVTNAEIRVDPRVAALLELPSDAELVHIERRRFADEEIIAVDRVWLPADLASGILGVDLTHTALYQELTQRCGITLDSGKETLHAVTTDAVQSGELSCLVGTAAFFIERLGCSKGRPVEWRESLIRGDRFTVTTSFSPRAAAASPSPL